MWGKDDSLPAGNAGMTNLNLPHNGDIQDSEVMNPGEDNEDRLDICRVCHCSEPDKKGEAALEFLGISPPSNSVLQRLNAKSLGSGNDGDCLANDTDIIEKKGGGNASYLEYISPDGEICICGTDLEAGQCWWHRDALIEMGCLCKNDLALAHYSCALRWFINRGSVVCEICGTPPVNVSLADHTKIIAALKECETLRVRTAVSELTSTTVEPQPDIDPDAVAAVRRQRLTEIASWFDPHNHATGAQGMTDQVSNDSNDDVFPHINPTTKWAVEGTGILVATGLLTVTLAWLIAPRVGKRTARKGLHVLLGGLCALTIVVFLRFVSMRKKSQMSSHNQCLFGLRFYGGEALFVKLNRATILIYTKFG